MQSSSLEQPEVTPKEEPTNSEASHHVSTESVPPHHVSTESVPIYGGEPVFRELDLSQGGRLFLFSTDLPHSEEERPLSRVLQARQKAVKETICQRGMKRQPNPWDDEVERSRSQWTYPIDNEAAKEKDEKASFDEHIFLERHMEDWVPKDGPVRAFMELVVHGLRKNPHMTAKRKRQYLQQMKDHFEKYGDDPSLFPQAPVQT